MKNLTKSFFDSFFNKIFLLLLTCLVFSFVACGSDSGDKNDGQDGPGTGCTPDCTGKSNGDSDGCGGTCVVGSGSTVPVNGDFELWIGGTLDSWSTYPGVEVNQESTIVRNGTYSARLTRLNTDAATTELQSPTAPVVGGAEYTASVWFFDNNSSVSMRYVCRWFNDSGTLISATPWQPIYTTDSSNWQEMTVTATAPVNAASARIAIRLYGNSTNGSTVSGSPVGGIIYIDDLTIRLQN